MLSSPEPVTILFALVSFAKWLHCVLDRFDWLFDPSFLAD
jgi:hypothetical protein